MLVIVLIGRLMYPFVLSVAMSWLANSTLIRVEEPEDAWLLMVLPTAHDGVFHLAGSLPHTDDRWQGLRRWIGRSAGRVIPVTLNESDFDSISPPPWPPQPRTAETCTGIETAHAE